MIKALVKSLAFPLPLAVIGGLGLYLWAGNDDRWLSTSQLNQPEADAALLESIQSSAAVGLMGWFLAVTAFGWLASAFFVVLAATRRPATGRAEAALRPVWLTLLLILTLAAAAYSWWVFGRGSLGFDLNQGRYLAITLIAVPLLLLLYWGATAFATPLPMKPSVPGGHLFAGRSRR